VFLVNSRLDLFTAAPSGSVREGLHPTEAPLLPKLRGNFAEFLNEGYLDHLSILYLSTCVGFGTGTCPLPRGFSRRHGVSSSPAFRPAGIAPRFKTRLRIYLEPLATRLPPLNRRRGLPTLPRPPIGHNVNDVVREYQPVGHRLRLSASP
jgi:hypothetical protein